MKRENEIIETLEQIKADLREIKAQGETFLSFEEASKYLNLSKSYLYKATSAGTIPFFKPGGKKCFFKKTELDEWIESAPIKTRGQIEQESTAYVMKNRGKR